MPAPAPAIEAAAPVAAPPVVVPEAAAEPPRPTAPAPPVGRVFEAFDVDESPRVATRIEPQIPGDLAERPVNDIVVVRVLVSQAGHPFSVAVLRRSRVGRSLDDAVVAAVSRWTFSPAQKRGEAVSCWLNMGVAVGH
jgi:TonB family protein